MNRKISLGVAISLIAVSIAVTCILTMTFSQNLFNSMISSGTTRTELSEIESYVQSNYLHATDEATIQQYISEAYVDSLGDKYSVYYTADEYAKQQQLDSGYTVGVGIEFALDESGYIKVASVDENSSASEMGIVPEDIIVSVNETDVLVNGYDNSVAMFGGTEGELVKITVRRDGVDSEYQLPKRKSEVTSVVGRMLDGYVGYVKITAFNSTTAGQFENVIDGLIADGADELIFDVRNCSGGLINVSSDMLNYVVPAGEWATATFKGGSQQVIVKTDSTYEVTLPIAVLVNENTSYAAEIFAAVLRDSGKASLVGTTTEGRGIMQYTQQLTTGAAITISVATYETSKTPCFDGVGIKPNFEVSLSDEEKENFIYLDETSDPQLKKAIDIVDTGV